MAKTLIGSRLLRLTFWGAASFAFVMAVLPKPPELPGDPSDKIQHIAAFATLAVLGAFSYPRRSAWLLLAGLIAFGALIELVQLVPELGRDGSIWDFLADGVAVAFVLLLVRGIPSLRRGRRAASGRGEEP